MVEAEEVGCMKPKDLRGGVRREQAEAQKMELMDFLITGEAEEAAEDGEG